MNESEIQTLMEHTLLSPTSFNMQNWRFVLVTDSEKKAQIKDGVEIEAVAEETPELIFKEHFDPAVGLEAYQVRKLCKKLGITGSAAKDGCCTF